MITSFVDQRTETQKLMFRIFDFELVKMAMLFLILAYKMQIAKSLKYGKKLNQMSRTMMTLQNCFYIVLSTKKSKYYLCS